MAEIKTLRRYYFLKSQASKDVKETALSAVWVSKKLSQPGDNLPATFPSYAALFALGYETKQDIDGADELELSGCGFNQFQIRQILNAMSDL